MTNTLWIPLWFIALGAAHFFGPSWLFIALSAVGTAFLTSLMQFAAGPSHDKNTLVKWDGFTLEELERDVLDPDGENDNLPLYLAGVGYGVLPVTDWFTANMGGRRVLILEHIGETK